MVHSFRIGNKSLSNGYMQNHVLSQYPKDYLKNENVRDSITELEDIHSGLSNTYFFKERLEEVDNFLKGKKHT